jgi:type IX secretion system PorP/SprF family membrane protein
MKKHNYILISVLLLISSTLFAQQESTFTLFRYHMNIVNPAYAGINNETLLTSSLRRQWTGVEDAPQTQSVSFGTALSNNLGFGISMVNDRTFIEKQTFVGIDFSYRLKMNETTDLYLGLKVGGNSYDVNTSGLETYGVQSDPALASIHSFNPNVGVGAVLKNEKYYVSLSIPRLLNREHARNEDGYAMVATDRPHVYLSGGYDFDLNSSLASLILKPSVMMRYVNGAPVSIDLNTMLKIENNLELGVMYRTDQAFAAMGNITISKRFLVGYAYEISTRKTLASSKNTNEILLQFRF